MNIRIKPKKKAYIVKSVIYINPKNNTFPKLFSHFKSQQSNQLNQQSFQLNQQSKHLNQQYRVEQSVNEKPYVILRIKPTDNNKEQIDE